MHKSRGAKLGCVILAYITEQASYLVAGACRAGLSLQSRRCPMLDRRQL